MRATILLSALLAAVSFTVGCGTASPWHRKSPVDVAKEDAAPETKPESKPAEVAKSDSPFQSSRERAAAKPDAGEKAVAATSPIEPPPNESKTEPPAVTKSSPTFTRETLQLIDSELRDATPAERARWYDELKQVDAELIPEILRARRLSLQLAESKPPATEASPQLSGNSVMPAASTAAEPPHQQLADRHAMRHAAHTEIQPGRELAHHAIHEIPAGSTQPVEQSVYKYDPQRPQQPIVLQNMEYQPPQNGTAQAPSPALDPRLLPQSATTSTPTAVPWPSPKSQTPASTNLSPFGSGFVQNVVGLMPNRGATVTPTSTTTAASPELGSSESSWRQELDRTTAFLEQEVAALKPGSDAATQAIYVRKHVALRMLYLMGEQQERALTAIPGLPPAEQEFWQQLFWGLSNALDSDHIPNPKDRATQTIAQLNSALRRLQEQADLQIRNVAFCRQIQYFGNYERFPRDEFRPGQEVLLYAEIDNFKSEPTADGQYRTLLRSTLELLSPSGELRKVIDFPATEDLCRNYRRDYFHNYQFVIPERLPLGPHTLKLTVFDELSGKMSSYSLNFVVK